MAWYQDRKVQIGGGVGAVAAVALGIWGLAGGGGSARVAELCGAPPAQLAEVSLASLVAEGAAAVGKAVGTDGFSNEIENNAVKIFRGTPEAKRGEVETAYRYAVCSAIAMKAANVDEARVKYTSAQEASGKGLLMAIAESQECVTTKTAAASAEEPFTVDGTATAVAAGSDGKEVVDVKTICHTAKAGFDFANVNVQKVACSAEDRCSVKEVRYAPDADGNKQACVDFEVKSEAKAFGAGAALNVKLVGAVTKSLTDAEKIAIATECNAAIPAITPAATEPTPAEPVTDGAAPATPATEAPAAPATEAPAAAPAEPATPTPATP